jgi:uncharacterized delta-60 repeat protein
LISWFFILNEDTNIKQYISNFEKGLSMRIHYILLMTLLCYISLIAQTKQNKISPSSTQYVFQSLVQNVSDSVNEAWVARYNGPGNDWDEALAITVDGLGNVYVTGGSIGQDLLNDYTTIKYNSSGTQEWLTHYNGTGNGDDKAAAIAVDGSGNVYVTGYSYGQNSSDYATVKYDSSGTEIWSARYNGSANNDDRATSIAVDNSGNVYVTGFSTGMISDYDYVTVKYNSSGIEQWVAVYNGPGNFFDLPCAVAVDDSGNILVSGWSSGSNGFNDYATVKYDSGGTQKWVARYHGPASEGDDACYDMAVDCTGNVYITGGSISEAGDRDYATVKYDPSGAELWVARYNGAANDFDVAMALAVDCSGNVYVTGKSAGTNTSLDYLTIKYNSSGVEVWTARYDGPANSEDGASAIAIDNSGNVYVTGISMGLDSDFDYATVKYNSSGMEEWALRYNGPGNGADASNGIAIDGSGNVLVTGYSFNTNSSSDYATVKYEEVIVPVELISFAGRAEQNRVILNWETATEMNNRGFDIERKVSSKQYAAGKWEKIGFVGGAGTTTEPKSYSFTDNDLQAGNYTYRLKQIDFDGTFKYSKEVDANVSVPLQFTLGQNYPNPFNPTTQIEYSIPKDGIVNLTVYNTLGQQVASLVNGNMNAGKYQVTFDASRFTSGVYYYRLVSGSNVMVKKMMILK